jgi:type II secretory pathway pseudopilin PulG
MLRSRAGYLMVEVLASLGLLGLALGGLVPAVVLTVRGVDQAKLTTAAATLGRDKIEEIRNTAYDAVTNGTDSVTQGRTYTRQWTVAAGPAGTTKAVTVTVRWSDRTSHQVTLQTIVGQ